MKRRTNQIKKSTFDKWFDAINMILMLGGNYISRRMTERSIW